MKINSIAYTKSNTINKTGVYKKQTPVFNFISKADSINFRNLDSFENKYNKYKTEITNYVLTARKITTKEIEQILKKYSQNITVKSVAQSPILRKSEGAINYVVQNYQIFNNGQKVEVATKDNTLYTNIPKKLDENSRVDYLKSILHEGIHVLYDSSSDKTSRVELVNGFLTSQNQNAKKVCEHLDKIIQNTSTVENLVSKHLKLIFMSERPKESEISEELINEYCKKHLDDNLKNCANIILMKFVLDNKNEIDFFGKENVLDYLSHVLTEEAEAYTKSLDTTGKIKNLDEIYTNGINIIERARVVFYKKIAELIQTEKIENNFKNLLSETPTE